MLLITICRSKGRSKVSQLNRYTFDLTVIIKITYFKYKEEIIKMAKAKIINLLLSDGNLDGLLTIEDSSWDGEMFISPRESVNKLFEQEETSFWGVYLLISEDKVYVGQANDLKRRIKQHDKKKDFWDKVVLITTKDDSLNRSAIDYIEHELIEKSKIVGTLHIENRQVGNKTKVSRFDKVRYDNFMENALLLLQLTGVKVFVGGTESEASSDIEKTGQDIEIPLASKIRETIPVVLISRNGANAKGDFNLSTQRIRLLKGSRSSSETRASFTMGRYDNLFDDRILSVDIPDLVPSKAAKIILRASNSGWRDWKDMDGNPIQKYRH